MTLLPDDLARIDDMTRTDGWQAYSREIANHQSRIVQKISQHSTPLEDVEYLRGQLEGLQLALRPISEKP